MAGADLKKLAQNFAVASYADYQTYLRDLYQAAKDSAEKYSYQQFAEDLGFSATNVLRLVIARKRGLAPKSARKIAGALGLKGVDRQYFLALVDVAHARGGEHRRQSFAQLLHAKVESLGQAQDKELMAYYADVSHPIIREASRLTDFRADPDWIAETLKGVVGPDRAQKSLALLTELGFLERDAKSGKLQNKDSAPRYLPSDATAGELAIVKYHEGMMELARSALTQVPSSRREMNAVTLCLSADKFKTLRKMIRDFCAQAMAEESDEQKRDCVVQLNVQLFALTQPTKRGDHEPR